MKTPTSALTEYMDAARSTGVFTVEEMVVLEEVVSEGLASPGQDYVVLAQHDEGGLAGYVIFGRTPMTTNTWDMYWVVVASRSQRQGVARALIAQAEAYMSAAADAVIRVETSSRPEYLAARMLYERCGYRLVGVIEDFYGPQDSLITYMKQIPGCRP